MITFEKIRLKNFVSVGNEPIELQLNTDFITTIDGVNGSGKSMLLVDSINYVLYGKSFRNIVLNDLINYSTKKNMVVEIWFTTRNKHYHIIRGLKPAIFEIYINEKLQPAPPSIKQYQSWLENEVIQINEKVFQQLVIIGSSSYIPFLKLTAKDRRIVIEQILDLNVFSSMNNIAKEEYSEILIEYQNFQNEIDKVKTAISVTNEYIDKNKNNTKLLDNLLENLSLKENQKKDLSVFDDIELQDIKKQLDDLSQEKAKYEDKIKQCNSMVIKKNTEKSLLSKDIKFLQEHENCPTCHQSIDSNFKKNKLNNLSEQIKKIDDFLNLIDLHVNGNEHTDGFKTSLKLVQNQILEMNNSLKEKEKQKDNLSHINQDIISLKNQINVCQKEKDKDIKDLQKKINDYKKQEEELNKKLDEKKSVLLSYKKFIDILKDDGAKAIITKQIVKILNNKINYYLKIIDSNFTFAFNEVFEDTITLNNEHELTYFNLSEGERLRINLAILFSLRDLILLQNKQSANLLILDEFDQGIVDEPGLYSLISIIKTLKQSNVFIISHNIDSFVNIADKNITIVKQNNFTTIQ